ECAHNLNYWTFGDYLGIGAGAHGKLTVGRGIRRVHKQRQPRAYMETAQGSRRIAGEREVAPREAAFEYMLNALRLCRGFSAGEFEARTGCDIPVIATIIEDAVARRLLEPTSEGWRPS